MSKNSNQSRKEVKKPKMENQENTSLNKPKPKRDEKGRLLPGNCGNENGRPKDTEEDKLKKKATKQLIAEYKEALGQSLPLIRPVLIAKAIEGDMGAIKEIHDRVMDKAKQPTDITTDGESIIPLLVKFVDGK